MSNCEVIVATKHRALEENPRARITIKSTMENVSFCLLLLKIGTAANTVFVNVTRGGYQTKYDLVIGLHDVIFFKNSKCHFIAIVCFLSGAQYAHGKDTAGC